MDGNEALMSKGACGWVVELFQRPRAKMLSSYNPTEVLASRRCLMNYCGALESAIAHARR